MVAQSISLSAGAFNYFLLGLEETLGPADVDLLVKDLNLASSSLTIIANGLIPPVAQRMTECYGITGARGLILCSGRAAFKHLLKQESDSLGFNTTQFRFLPTRSKLKMGLEQLAAWMQRASGETIQIRSNENHWFFEIKGRDDGKKQSMSESLCDFTAGLLQEFLAWAGSGKFYSVREQSCRADGAECCSFAIDKYPLD